MKVLMLLLKDGTFIHVPLASIAAVVDLTGNSRRNAFAGDYLMILAGSAGLSYAITENGLIEIRKAWEECSTSTSPA